MATLAELPKIKELIEAIMPYTNRHFQRLDRLLQASHFVSYTLASMQILLPPVDPNAKEEEASEDENDTAACRQVR